MKYIDKLKDYANQRISKIQEKHKYIEDLQGQLKAKRDEIKKLEVEYQQSMDDKVFTKLLESKKDADSVQDDITKVSEIIPLIDKGSFQYDALESEIDKYISGLELEKLKDQIAKAKDAYIASLNKFDKALNDIIGVKASISEYKKYTDKQTRQSIINYLTKHSKEYFLEDDQVINQIEHENLIRSIRGKGPGIYVDNNFIKGDE